MPARKHTDEQIQEAISQAGTMAGAARLLGVDERGLRRRCQRNGIKADISEMPLKRLSRNVDAEGNVRQEWRIYETDKKRQADILQAWYEGIKEDIPKAAPVKPPRHTQSDLLNLYTITDYHLGMYAWHEETGEDWDVKTAEDLIYAWFAKAIQAAPDSKTAVFAQLGDFLHFDGLEAITPTNKHLLDADTRFQLIIRISIRVIRRIMQMLLGKHQHVHVIMAIGNHDPASSGWLREMMADHYRNSKRVTVDCSADAYYCYEHGLTSLFFHHGHKRGPDKVSTVFAGKFRDVFGRTKHSYAHLGHLHNSRVVEDNLMIVEQHPTLAAKDAYASHGGWLSHRSAKVVTYHRQNGKCAEVCITPDMCK